MKHSRALSCTVGWWGKRFMAATTASTPRASATRNWFACNTLSLFHLSTENHQNKKTRNHTLSFLELAWLVCLLGRTQALSRLGGCTEVMLELHSKTDTNDRTLNNSNGVDYCPHGSVSLIQEYLEVPPASFSSWYTPSPASPPSQHLTSWSKVCSAVSPGLTYQTASVPSSHPLPHSPLPPSLASDVYILQGCGQKADLADRALADRASHPPPPPPPSILFLPPTPGSDVCTYSAGLWARG